MKLRPFVPVVLVFWLGLPLSASGAEASAGREAVQARYRAAQQEARTGNPEQALRELVWCFDEGMVRESSFSGVRLSFLVGDFARLAQRHPPAEEFMRRRCTEAELRMFGGEAAATQEFAAWCGALGEEARLLEAFGRIPAGDPRRRLFGLRVFRSLLTARRYPEALEVLPFEAMLRLLGSNPTRADAPPGAADAARRFAVNNGLDYLEAVAGAKQMDQAAQLREKLKVLDDSPETRSELEKRLARAALPAP